MLLNDECFFFSLLFIYFFLDTVCRGVCRFYRSANERLGVSGFQVLVLWDGRWVTGLMNSDGRQLLINQETVCQQLLPECVHTKLHVNPHQLENTSARTPGRADAPTTGTHTHAPTHTHHSYLLHLAPLCLLLSRGQSCLSSPDSMSRMCLLPMCSHHPRWGKLPAQYGNTCQM